MIMKKLGQTWYALAKHFQEECCQLVNVCMMCRDNTVAYIYNIP